MRFVVVSMSKSILLSITVGECRRVVVRLLVGLVVVDGKSRLLLIVVLLVGRAVIRTGLSVSIIVGRVVGKISLAKTSLPV